MPGLSTTLLSSANALQVFDKALATIQNNVANALTPGYAKQRLSLEAMPFGLESGMPGGVTAGELDSARNEYAEQAVRHSAHDYGSYRQAASDLAGVEPLFEVSGTAGLPGALNALFQSFLSWSVTPNDNAARQLVLDRAAIAAGQFVDTATRLRSIRGALDQPIEAVVGGINRIAARIRDLNAQVESNFESARDPNLDARYAALLEDLAEYADFTALRQPDGSVSVLLGGQTPLVLGSRQFAIASEAGGGTVVLRDAEGRDITSQVRSGRLGALIETRNTTIPSYISTLDRLAAAFADRVNATLATGVDSAGQPGAPLFAYDATAGAALTLHVTAIAPAELAGAVAGAPGGNGNALNLADLARSKEIDGATFLEFYGQLAARVGQDVAAARENQQTHEQVLLQAQSLRDQASGVSLDEEAARLVQFQRSYEAAARVLTTIDELLETTIAMLR